ncbi:GspH/FimT family pseudopilin [Pseudomonas baetica]|uniref:GspH/FimT family pseudopilin n=1 Tax=Pseudomonas baetica TaxID=674054 RepID=UPI003EECFB18
MRQHGFSLIELLMGLTIVGIVLHLVSPAFAAVMESNYREEAARSLASGLRSARSEAIARNQTVVIHGINGDWGQGWRMILDVSGKGYEDDSNPLLIERRSGIPLPVFGNTYVKTSVRFSPLGEPVHGGLQSGTLHICATREPLSLNQVVLAKNGRVSLRSKKTEQAVCVGGEDSEQGTNA